MSEKLAEANSIKCESQVHVYEMQLRVSETQKE